MRDLTLGENPLKHHVKTLAAQEFNKRRVSDHVFQNLKYSKIKREDLRCNLMDRQSNYRLKVEDDMMAQFKSDKIKQESFFKTLRADRSAPALQRATY